MTEPEASEFANARFHGFIESGEALEERGEQALVIALDNIRPSPFKDPYPVQKRNDSPISGYAGELRGFYRRSDGDDRWKPSWSAFGHPRNGSAHQGIDMYARVETPVVAIFDGYAMLYPNPAPGDELGIKAGITIKGSDNKRYDVLYGHLSRVEGVSRAVKKGDVIGYTGCTGNAEDGTCAAPNRCNGHSSHLHIAVRESATGASYIDPGVLFGWKLAHAGDARDVPCDQAFPHTHVVEEILHEDSGRSLSQEALLAAQSTGESRRFRLQSFSTELKRYSETQLAIYENLEINLTPIDGREWKGLSIEIRGRERHFFHPAPSRHVTVSIIAQFENVGEDGNPVGLPIQVRLTRLENEVPSDTGLSRLYVKEFALGGKLDFGKPIRFLGVTLEPA